MFFIIYLLNKTNQKNKPTESISIYLEDNMQPAQGPVRILLCILNWKKKLKIFVFSCLAAVVSGMAKESGTMCCKRH